METLDPPETGSHAGVEITRKIEQFVHGLHAVAEAAPSRVDLPRRLYDMIWASTVMDRRWSHMFAKGTLSPKYGEPLTYVFRQYHIQIYMEKPVGKETGKEEQRAESAGGESRGGAGAVVPPGEARPASGGDREDRGGA